MAARCASSAVMPAEIMRAALSIGLAGSTESSIIRSLAPRIERLGFAGLWVNDTPDGDSLAALRIAAAATQRLQLATGVIPLDRRPAASLEFTGLPAERLTIGIGSGGANDALRLVREGIETIRRATDAAVVVGALGPRMRRLGARCADGVLLSWLTPDAARAAMADLRRDAQVSNARDRDAQGRDAPRPDPRGILYARTIVDEAARPALEREAGRYDGYPAYAANFDRIGARAIDTTIDGRERLAEIDVVDEIVLRAVTPTGSLDELEHFVEEAARWNAGVD
jgi:alkanesulfonate monooxygenase SsuD/methylene tetrahydromethanopterin reductase-like flavin-dependent oxidoreductase (luciferase family)